MRTKYLFDEDKAMTPLIQMQATKNLLTEARRIAYTGLCSFTSREMVQSPPSHASQGNEGALGTQIMGRLYYHMERKVSRYSQLYGNLLLNLS